MLALCVLFALARRSRESLSARVRCFRGRAGESPVRLRPRWRLKGGDRERDARARCGLTSRPPARRRRSPRHRAPCGSARRCLLGVQSHDPALAGRLARLLRGDHVLAPPGAPADAGRLARSGGAHARAVASDNRGRNKGRRRRFARPAATRSRQPRGAREALDRRRHLVDRRPSLPASRGQDPHDAQLCDHRRRPRPCRGRHRARGTARAMRPFWPSPLRLRSCCRS